MDFEELGIKGAWIARSPIHHDNRGTFREWFKPDQLKTASGIDFEVKQANVSNSKKGVIRGIHYSLARNGQGKWVTCTSGSIWDVVVDIRPESPTFRKWIGLELSEGSGESIFVSNGLGHGFVSLQNDSTVVYLLNSEYSPREEFEISPLDADLGITWPLAELSLSDKDRSAPTLREQLSAGNLKTRL